MARPWFQIHLTTALVMLIVAAWIVHLNLQSRGLTLNRSQVVEHGWPLIFSSASVTLRSTSGPVDVNAKPLPPRPIVRRSFFYDALAINFVVLLLCLGAVFIAFEWFRCQFKSVLHWKIHFQIHLSTALVMMIVGGALLGINIYLVNLPETLWESGLPVFAWSRDAHYSGQLAMRLPGVLVLNIALNIALWVLIGIAFEQFVRGREARKPRA